MNESDQQCGHQEDAIMVCRSMHKRARLRMQVVMYIRQRTDSHTHGRLSLSRFLPSSLPLPLPPSPLPTTVSVLSSHLSS